MKLKILGLLTGLLAPAAAFGQSAGTMTLAGPSTSPGAPQITPQAINTAVNSQLTSKLDVSRLGQPSGVAALNSSGNLQLSVSTVAGLPSCGSGQKGELAAVSDATSPTYNGALTGGGTVSVPVYCNGSAWTSH